MIGTQQRAQLGREGMRVPPPGEDSSSKQAPRMTPCSDAGVRQFYNRLGHNKTNSKHVLRKLHTTPTETMKANRRISFERILSFERIPCLSALGELLPWASSAVTKITGGGPRDYYILQWGYITILPEHTILFVTACVNDRIAVIGPWE